MSKLDKSVTLYCYRPEQNYTCGMCVFADTKGSLCKLFGPGEKISLKTGGCNLWIHSDDSQREKVPMLGLVTAEEAGYMDSDKGFSCARCGEFLPLSKDCRKVNKDSPGDTPGTIEPGACCSRFEPDAKRSKLDTAALLEALADESNGESMEHFKDRRMGKR